MIYYVNKLDMTKDETKIKIYENINNFMPINYQI